MKLLVIGAAALLVLAGCTPRVVKEFVPVEVVRYVYVEVPPELTDEHPIATGPQSACIDVAAKRAEALRQCNLDKALTRSIEGQAAPER